MPTPKTPHRNPDALPPGLVSEDDGDRRRLRVALAAAVIFHGLLFLIHLPPERAAAEPPPEPRLLYVVDPLPKVRQPEPQPEPPPEIPPERTPRRLVPMPEIPEPPEITERPLELTPQDDVPPPRWTELPPLEIPDGPPELPVDEILEVSGDVVAPVRLHAPLPRYTETARRRRIQGTVVVRAVIDRDGAVRDVEVVKGLPMGLTERAVEAVKSRRYRPATLAGRPVDVYFNLQVSFRLN